MKAILKIGHPTDNYMVVLFFQILSLKDVYLIQFW